MNKPPNKWMSPERIEPFAALSDGTPLYPAYYPLRPGESFRRAMRFWDGASGEWVGVTLDGRLFRQSQCWGSEGPHPDRWEQFRIRYG
jgi:hypothetical protein